MQVSSVIYPGIYFNEKDNSFGPPQPVSQSIGALVGEFPRGSLEPRLHTTALSFTQMYGKPDVAYGYAGHTGIFFLDFGRRLWVARAVGAGAKYGLGFFANEWVEDGKWSNTSWTPVPSGTAVPLSATNLREAQDIVFSADLATGHTFNATINGTPITPVPFTGSNNNTLSLIAAAIQQQVDVAAPGGTVTVALAPSGNNHTVRVVSPETVAIDISGAAVTGTSPPTTTVRPTDVLFWVQAENPGEWSKNIVPKLRRVNNGYIQRLRMTLSGPLLASSVIGGYVTDGTTQYPIGPITFNSDSDTTLQALATAIENTILQYGAGAAATVQKVSGSVSNDRNIDILPPSNNKFNLLFTGMVVTGTGQQPTLTTVETMTRVPPTGGFDLEIYEQPNFNVPLERFNQVQLFDVTDPSGQSADIEHVVNINEGTQSILIRVVRNDMFEEREILNEVTDNYNVLTGGMNGSPPTSADIINAWQQFRDPENITVRLLLNAGYGASEVQQAMDQIAAERQDCVAILDMPTGKQQAPNAANYRTTELNVNSSYSAMYGPDVQTLDQASGKKIYVPSSGMVGAQMVYTDQVANEAFAAAGLQRGVLRRATGLRYYYGKGDREILTEVQLNPILRINNVIQIYGDFSLQVANSDLQVFPVRRAMIGLRTRIVDAVAFSMFEPNDEDTRAAVRQVGNEVCADMRRRRMLKRYAVICDDTNNPPAVEAARELHLDLQLVFIKPVIKIIINATLQRDLGQFNETVAPIIPA